MEELHSSYDDEDLPDDPPDYSIDASLGEKESAKTTEEPSTKLITQPNSPTTKRPLQWAPEEFKKRKRTKKDVDARRKIMKAEKKEKTQRQLEKKSLKKDEISDEKKAHEDDLLIERFAEDNWCDGDDNLDDNLTVDDSKRPVNSSHARRARRVRDHNLLEVSQLAFLRFYRRVVRNHRL